MSKYTSGELAKRCGVTIRTIRYYDEKGLLTPAAIDDNHYRIYSQKEEKQLLMILFLKDLGFSLKQIKAVIKDENGSKTLNVLVQQKLAMQEEKVRQEEARLKNLERLNQLDFSSSQSSLSQLLDIQSVMKKTKQLKRQRLMLLGWGILASLIQLLALIWSWIHKQWWVFIVAVLVALVISVFASRAYFRAIAYLCPHCQNIFAPSYRNVIFSRHTPKTRKLTCPHCQQTSFCIEVIRPED